MQVSLLVSNVSLQREAAWDHWQTRCVAVCVCVCARVCMCPFVTTATLLLTSLLVSSSCLGEFHSTWWKRSYASGNPLRFPQVTDHNSRTKFIFCCSQRFSAWDPRGIKVVARANENLLNTLVLRTGENWPQLVIRCSHHQSESTSVFYGCCALFVLTVGGHGS